MQTYLFIRTSNHKIDYKEKPARVNFEWISKLEIEKLMNMKPEDFENCHIKFTEGGGRECCRIIERKLKERQPCQSEEFKKWMRYKRQTYVTVEEMRNKYYATHHQNPRAAQGKEE